MAHQQSLNNKNNEERQREEEKQRKLEKYQRDHAKFTSELESLSRVLSSDSMSNMKSDTTSVQGIGSNLDNPRKIRRKSVV